MKIGQPSDNPMLVSTTAQPAASKGSQSASLAAQTHASATAAKSTESAGVAVTVTVSTMARALGTTHRGEPADVDMTKVSAMRDAIRQGTFKVDAEAIADKLLGNAQEMLDQNRHSD